MSYAYTVEKGNVVKIWYGDISTAAVLVQATWPSGEKWSSKEEAEAWAQVYIAAQDDPEADRPGDSPESPSIPVAELEPSPEEWSEREAIWAAEIEARAEADAEAAAAFEATVHPLGAPDVEDEMEISAE